MNVNHVNAISRATKGILTNHLGVEVTPLKASAGKGNVPSRDVAVILGIKGELSGQIICTFSSETAKKIVSVMMGGMEIQQLDEIGWSAVQEFGNWVAGTTATELSKESCIIDVTPPIVNEGESKFHSSYPYVTVPLTSIIGEIDVHIAVKEEILEAH
ncbi:chemotaxis protein CheX [Halalkalibacterium ligniniphilum]|uniref:chemotaxis protein CheX n=1 Tax=Halalkalibacterium ligniniphilum TaxID=1134413 RepID=UPI000345FBE2|nr:chemotaxis protein CheX [Halalkalibacterium ligniniphilum]